MTSPSDSSSPTDVKSNPIVSHTDSTQNISKLSEKSDSEKSKATLSTNRKEKPSKGKKSKANRRSKIKNMGIKGFLSIFFCIGSEEKSNQRERTTAEKPIVPEASSSEETTEVPALTTSESIPQPETKPSVDDLIYSASPDADQKDPIKVDIVQKEIQASFDETKPLLEPISAEHQGRKCLVLDLDETLVHSSFKLIDHPDFIVPVEIDNQIHNVYVAKRPGVDEFLKKMGEVYEVVVFTASLSKYADPVLDMLDIHRVVKHRLFRESCYNHNGNYVKDLSQIGRELQDTIIIDNSPTSYLFHPANAVPITTWFNDIHDTELLDLIPFLNDLATVDDVTKVLDNTIDDYA